MECSDDPAALLEREEGDDDEDVASFSCQHDKDDAVELLLPTDRRDSTLPVALSRAVGLCLAGTDSRQLDTAPCSSTTPSEPDSSEQFHSSSLPLVRPLAGPVEFILI